MARTGNVLRLLPQLAFLAANCRAVPGPAAVTPSWTPARARAEALAAAGPDRGRGDVPDSIQVYLPVGLIKHAVGEILPAIEKEIDATVMPTCCWNNVVKTHVHLDFEAMKINGTRLSADVEQRDGQLYINVAATLRVHGFYRLCFGLGGCDTVKGCKGNFYLDPFLNAAFQLSVGGSDQTGALQVAVNTSMTDGHVFLNNSLCPLFHDAIATNIPAINKALLAAVSNASAGIAKKLSSVFPLTLINTKKMVRRVPMTIETFS